MNDEYGNLQAAPHSHSFPELQLQNGGVLNPATVAYHCYGSMNADKSNVIVVCHALTGNSDCAAWWSDLVGPNKTIDTFKFFVICMNVLGSCYGTTGPTVCCTLPCKFDNCCFALVRKSCTLIPRVFILTANLTVVGSLA